MKRSILFGILILLIITGLATAAPTTAQQARKVVEGWLRADMQPLGATLGRKLIKVETFSDDNGQPIYYVVYVQPSGFVIVSADDLIEPIVGFADDGTYDPSTDNPLGALVSRDLPGRIASVRELQAKVLGQAKTKGLTAHESALQKASLKAQSKWSQLQESDDIDIPLGAPSISDEWVTPLVQSKWSQTKVAGNACYNYYTPPYDANDPNNYPCGCVATAMAQLMRYHEYPNSPASTGPFTIYVDGYPQTAYLRGGPYNYSNMPLNPLNGTTEAQRQAIGELCYDAGVAVEMQYTAYSSGAFMDTARNEIVDTFNYNNAIYASDWRYGLSKSKLNGMINPNLDSGNPVLLGITESGVPGGHAVIADGYGYISTTLYHHINMGWAGYDDAWYNLPTIDSTYYSFDTVDVCIYNIFISGSGEIISGRITDEETGDGLSDVNVTAEMVGGGTYNTTTNSNGIYAFANVPSDSTFTVSASKDLYTFTPPNSVNTGISANISGNCWGIDFKGSQYATIIDYPYTESFEIDGELGDWRNAKRDDIDWTQWSGSTPSSGFGTGPLSAIDGNNYLYTESSVEGSPYKEVILNGPYFDLNSLSNPEFRFWYHMYGGTMGTLAAEVSDDKGASWTEIWSLSGDQGDSWYEAVIDLSAYSGSKIRMRFVGVTGSLWLSDMAIDYITVAEAGAVGDCITSYPYTESFEDGFGDWDNAEEDDIDWTQYSGPTPSSGSGTGPLSAYDGTYYLYTESTYENYPDKKAILAGPCFNLNSLSNPELWFSYHMYGGTMGTLAVEVSNDNGASWTEVWSLSGNQGDSWFEAVVDLSTYSGSKIRVRFVGVTGSGFTSDMAIDYVSVVDRCMPGDFYPDCVVNFDDLIILCEQWLQAPGVPSADIAPGGGDGFVDFLDFALFTKDWMK
ncbi:MAG: C10 family peptidase [Planctomycetota bacterium]